MGRAEHTDTAAGADTGAWGRQRLLTILAAGLVAGLLLLAGLGFAAYYALSPAGPAPTSAAPAAAGLVAAAGTEPAAGAARGQARRDRIAATPMLRAGPRDARAGTPAAIAGPTIAIPAAGRTGPAGIPTGFPRTPAGAIGQLAAIETAVLQGMSIPQANRIHQAWAMPGGPGVAAWPMTANVQAFLAAAGQGQAKDPGVAVTATPVAGQVKGADGPGWVLACVLLDVRAVIAAESRIAYGHCERMEWAGGEHGRWMIGPGPGPAKAPSTWPGTDLAFKAGWRTWVEPHPGQDDAGQDDAGQDGAGQGGAGQGGAGQDGAGQGGGGR